MNFVRYYFNNFSFLVNNTSGDDEMNHEIDLGKYQLRTDLAIEAIDGFEKEEKIIDGVKITNILIDETVGKRINKKEGMYVTIEFKDITDYSNNKKVMDIFAERLKKLLEEEGISKEANCLVVGLGNLLSTPDSLGPLVIDNVLVTSHLFMLGEVEEGFRCVSAFAPGVTGKTGIETSELVKSIVMANKPDFVIVVDALASQSVERVNKTLQMTNTGIHPGSGVGNSRKEISKDTLGIPVLAIGVPTVVDAVTIVSDTINYMYKHYSYTKENIDKASNKLIIGGRNYLKSDVNIDKEDKKKLFGMVGNLEDEELRQLIYEVLTPIGYNLMVTPKEVDFVIQKLSDLISNGINKALHKNV